MRVDLNARKIKNAGGKALLIGKFYRHELVAEARIPGKRFNALKLRKICDPALTHSPGKQTCKAGICNQQPAPLGNAVGLIAEALRPYGRKIGKKR